MSRSNAHQLDHVADVLRAVFLAAAIAILLLGDDGGWFLVAAFVVSLLPRVMGVARPFEVAYVLAMGLNGFGNAFRLYEQITLFDEGAHLSLGYTDTLVDMALGAVSALLAAGFVIAWGERARSGVERA